MKRLLIPNDLRADRRQTYTLLLVALLLLCGASSLTAQGSLGNPDSENLGGRGPGDMVVVYRGGTPYVEMLNFDAHQIVTYRLGADNALTEVGRTPTCDEPRQLDVTPSGRSILVACSNERTIRAYRVLPTPASGSAALAKRSNGYLEAGGVFQTNGQTYDITKCDREERGPGVTFVAVNRDTGEVVTFSWDDDEEEFLPQVDPPDLSVGLGREPHVGVCRFIDNRPVLASLRRAGAARALPGDLGVIVVGNSLSNDLTVARIDRDGKPQLLTNSVPLGGSPRALSFDPSGRRLFVAVRSTPPAEDQIRTYRVGPAGELTFVGSTAAGRFATDIEATADRVFLVTINSQNRDEIRTYRRRGNDLILDSAITTPSQPNFKQITVGPSQGNLTNVFVTEYQGGFMRSLTYSRDNQVACVGDAENLCLNGMELQVDFLASDTLGYGQAAALTSDTGYFWFFNRDNIEIVPKVLDARTVNGSFWVFYGALSNVAYTLRVTDTRTGRVKVYGNPAGTLASSADTSAFPAASGGPRKTAAASTTSAEELYALFTGGQSAQAPATFAACAPGSARLCVTQNRFQVQVDWRVPGQGRSGSGTAVQVTGDTGYFWFFDSANVELIIKVLDARVINGKFWVFYGALSNVEYTITVTDTETGAVKTYANPSGTLASIADTSAF